MKSQLPNDSSDRQCVSSIALDSAVSTAQFAADVRLGLATEGQKKLPPSYFYDELGSTLFEAITLLPEYGLTRADARLLQQHASDIIRLSRQPSVIAELGSGSGSKTRFLLESLPTPRGVAYCPIDVSRSSLEKCELELQRISSVRIQPIEDSYLRGLERAVRLRRSGSRVLILFLGSTIGNFDPPEAERFCRSVRDILKEGDVFLLSTDLQKSVARTIAAYDDALGVTAAFNLNLLVRINRELGGNFDLAKFLHVAVYDESVGRIEMHLKSQSNQTVMIGGDLVVNFREGETIWTESSYKFRSEELRSLATRTGFHCEAQWIDDEWPFAQSVFRAV